MDRIPVSSSNVSSVGYDPGSKTLEVEYNNGEVYQYDGVPQDRYEELMAATSKGRFLNAVIKPYYGFTRA